MQSVGLVFSGVLWLSLTLKRVKHSLLSAGRMPDSTGEGEWGGERARFPVLLFAFPSISTLPQPPPSLQLSTSVTTPPPLQRLCNACPIFLEEDVRKQSERERVYGRGTGEGKRQTSGGQQVGKNGLTWIALHHHLPEVPYVSWCSVGLVFLSVLQIATLQQLQQCKNNITI